MIRKIAQFGNRLVLVPSSGVRLNLIWMAAGSAMQAASGWLSVVVLAKLGSPNVVGSYALAVAIVVPTIALLNLQLRENMVTDARASRPFSDYYRLRLITVTVALFAISLLGLVALDGAFSWGLLAAVTVGKLAEAVSDIVYGVFQKRERLDLVAKFVSCRSILGVTALWGVMMVSRNAVLACLASSLCSVGVLALAEIKASARFANSAAPVDSGNPHPLIGVWPLAVSCLPLGIVTLMNSLAVYGPRYFIAAHAGKIDLGAYAVIHSTLSAFYLFQTSTGAAAMPRLARYFAQGDRGAFMKLSQKVVLSGLLISAAIVAATYFFGTEILKHLYSREYSSYADLFFWMAVSSAFTCLSAAVSFLVHTTRQFAVNAYTATLTAALIALLSAVSVPRYGLYGAVLAVMIGSITTLLISSVQLVRILRSISNASYRPVL